MKNRILKKAFMRNLKFLKYLKSIKLRKYLIGLTNCYKMIIILLIRI